ncbi:MAG: ABC transporter permease [Chloroflexi bacterium]|nr:ABC transporter permease [Chloroflexota bacterium]
MASLPKASQKATPPAYRSTSERPSTVGLVAEGFREIASRRRLIRYLVQADMKKKGANTVLGNVWWVIDPLMLMIVYVVLVTVITQRPQPDYPLFIFSAILPWKWFTSTVSDAVTSVTGQERLIKQLHFPKLVLPVASTFSGVTSFVFGLIPLGLLLVLFYSDRITPYLLLIPVVAFVQLVLSMGLAIGVSAVNVFYRDLGNAIRHFLRLWFYLSPALYSAEQISSLGVDDPTITFLFGLNPFTILFESYRNVIYAGTPPMWGPLLALLAVSVAITCLATWGFKRLEPAFAKVL